MMKRIRHLSKYLSLYFFLGLVFAAFIGSFFSHSGKLDENRTPAEFPKALTLKFPTQFEAYYKDNFPQRRSLLKKYNKLRINKFGINERVILGKEDWMYYNSVNVDITSDTVADFKGSNKYSPQRLQEVTDFFIKQINRFKQYGAEVYVIFPPNKMTVYPEYLPEAYEGKQTPVSSVNQVEEALREQGVNVVTVQDEFAAAKQKDRLYWRTDTHWNQYGAYLAYRKLMNEISRNPRFATIKPMAVKKMLPADRACGDLYVMLGTQDKCLDFDYEISYSPALKSDCEHIDRDDIIKCRGNGSKFKMLVIRDSFYGNMLPLTSVHFAETMAYGRKFNHYPLVKEYMESQKPQIVVLEYVERHAGKITHEIFKDE